MMLWCQLKKGTLLTEYRAHRNNSKKTGSTSREYWRGSCKNGITRDVEERAHILRVASTLEGQKPEHQQKQNDSRKAEEE
jgi:hypothetical protein